MFKYYGILWLVLGGLTGCVHSNRIGQHGLTHISEDSVLRSAHIGIAIWDTEKNKYLFRHQADRYFVPASNVKLATLYAALKYLPDTLPVFDYYETADSLYLIPNGDPSFLHPSFSARPTIDFLKQQGKPIVLLSARWDTEIYGKGWAWDDYSTAYMPEKSPLPLSGKKVSPHVPGDGHTFPSLQNLYQQAADKLSDTLGIPVSFSLQNKVSSPSYRTWYGISRDSVCRRMMFESDNGIAEQLLLMTSDRLAGTMNEKKGIENLLSDTVLVFPQQPVWVDGSGLSRYNLFTPEDMVYLLQKIEKEFGTGRIKSIFPTGNEGTLKNYYDDKAGFLYAKTGTLSGQLSLCGYLITQKKTPLIFSIMINNHTAKATQLRKWVASYVDWMANQY